MTRSFGAPVPRRQRWERMELTYVGRVTEVIQLGGGKLSIPSDDPGEILKKPRGRE